MKYKINKQVIQETMMLIGPAFIPSIQDNFAKDQAANTKNRKELDAFKKDYSGYADYKTYSDVPNSIKRGAIFGAGTGALLAGGLSAASHYTNPDYDLDPAIPAGLGAIALGSGMVGGAAGATMDKMLKVPSLNQVVRKQEKIVK